MRVNFPTLGLNLKFGLLRIPFNSGFDWDMLHYINFIDMAIYCLHMQEYERKLLFLVLSTTKRGSKIRGSILIILIV